jgi:hypothetical protein
MKGLGQRCTTLLPFALLATANFNVAKETFIKKCFFYSGKFYLFKYFLSRFDNQTSLATNVATRKIETASHFICKDCFKT